MSVPLGSQTTEPAADTFQRFEMEETAPSAAQGALDIGSAPAAPPQGLEQPQPTADPRPLAGVASSCRPASASSAQQEAAKQVANADMPKAGRARWRSWRLCATPGVVVIGVDRSIEGGTGSGALNLYK
jgi:hypothetical protein